MPVELVRCTKRYVSVSFPIGRKRSGAREHARDGRTKGPLTHTHTLLVAFFFYLVRL